MRLSHITLCLHFHYDLHVKWIASSVDCMLWTLRDTHWQVIIVRNSLCHRVWCLRDIIAVITFIKAWVYALAIFIHHLVVCCHFLLAKGRNQWIWTVKSWYYIPCPIQWLLCLKIELLCCTKGEIILQSSGFSVWRLSYCIVQKEKLFYKAVASLFEDWVIVLYKRRNYFTKQWLQ